MGPMANVLHSSVQISLCCLWIVVAHLCLSSGQRFSPFPVRTLICDRSGSADAWIMIRDAESAEFVVCVCYHEVHLVVWLQKGENFQTKLSWKRYYNHTLMYIHQKMKTFHPRMTLTQMTLLTQPAHSGLSIKLSTYCTCDPQVGRGSHWIMTNSGTPHH